MMNDSGRPPIGSIGWLDLTVDAAEEMRDFYRQVVGWKVEPADCRALGGEVISGPRSMDGSRYCVIRDPAGAVSALYQPA